MVFEIVGQELVPCYFKLSDDGVNWGDPEDTGTLIVSKEGYKLKSTPYVIWVPAGGENGTLVATGMSINMNGIKVGDGYLINRNLGEGPWTHVPGILKYPADKLGGYSQCLISLDDQVNEILNIIPVPNGDGQHMDIKAVKFRLPVE